MAKRKALFVQLHDVFYLPGVGQMDKSLPSQSKSFSKFDMEYQEETGCVYITIGSDPRQAGGEFVLPAASIKVVKLAPAEKAEKAPSTPAAKKVETAKAS